MADKLIHKQVSSKRAVKVYKKVKVKSVYRLFCVKVDLIY